MKEGASSQIISRLKGDKTNSPIRLGKRIENEVELVRFDANTSIGNTELNLAVIVLNTDETGCESNLTFGSKL